MADNGAVPHAVSRSALFVCTLTLGWALGGRAEHGEPGNLPGSATRAHLSAGATPNPGEACAHAAAPGGEGAGLGAAEGRCAQGAGAPAAAVAGAARAAERDALELEPENFFGVPDAPVLSAMREGTIAKIEKGGGGRSLGFRVTFKGGQRAYFKPEQTFSAANWFSEVAAYHLDRTLGIGRVPPVVSRKLPWEPFAKVAAQDRRLHEIVVREEHVRGALVAWVDGPLTRMEQEERWEPWLRLTRLRTTAVSPFQRPSQWKRQMNAMKRMGREWRSKDERARIRKLRPEPLRADRPGELSDLIVFDYLTRNLDRWGGRNGNILIRGAEGPLVFLDNGAGFAPGDPRPELLEARLEMIERFRRQTIMAVRALDLTEYEARLASEPLAPILTRTQLEGLAARREALLARVASLEAVHGQAIWIWD